MKVCVEVDKSIKYGICNTVFFFPSGGGVVDMLLRLSLIKQIFKDVNLMFISFSL